MENAIIVKDVTKNFKVYSDKGNTLKVIISTLEELGYGVSYDILNAKYLIDILSQISKENVVFKIEDGISPLLIKQENDESLLFVLMPIRL